MHPEEASAKRSFQMDQMVDPLSLVLGENDFNKGLTRDDKATGSVQERDTLLGSTETKQVSRCLGGGFGSQTSVDLAKTMQLPRVKKRKKIG